MKIGKVGRKAELDDEAPTQVGSWSEGEVRDAISDDESEVDWKAELEDSISNASWRSVQKESWKARHLAQVRSRVRRQNWTMQYPAQVGSWLKSKLKDQRSDEGSEVGPEENPEAQQSTQVGG